jgi:hypothetical protein
MAFSAHWTRKGGPVVPILGAAGPWNPQVPDAHGLSRQEVTMKVRDAMPRDVLKVSLN